MCRRRNSGFTLIELVVATAILGIAVAAILGSFGDSLRAFSRASEYDKIALASKQKMEELLVDSKLPRNQALVGNFSTTSGWIARVTPWDMAGTGGPGTVLLDRIELESWWMSGSARRTFKLEGYRRSVVLPGDSVAPPQ